MTTPRRGLLAFVGCFCALTFVHCGTGGDGDVGIAGPLVLQVGDGVLVVAPTGSLISERPTNDAERVSALTNYFRSRQDVFGPGVDPSTLSFIEAAGQRQMTHEAGATYTLLALNQTYLGAPIIDEIQMGAFLQTGSGDELRRVRGQPRNPSLLPTPFDPEDFSSDLITPVVDTLLDLYSLPGEVTNVSEAPVISAQHGICGYLVSQFHPTSSGSFFNFRAVIDPRDLSHVVLAGQPPCDATDGDPPDALVTATLPPVFNLPGFQSTRFIRIHAVRLVDSDGVTNYAPILPEHVRIWVDAANQVWFPHVNVIFNFDDSPGTADLETWAATFLNTVPADEDAHATYAAAANVWSLLFHHTKLVVFFRANGGPGWSWGPTHNFFVSMPSYTQTWINKPLDGTLVRNDTLLSHELGHYFGLAHTFGDKACVDVRLANSNGDLGGQDPTTVDDDVGDTNSDMSDACVPTPSLTCVGGTINYNGELWDPPWNNVMSYHDCLPEAFTQHQIDAILRALQHPVRAQLQP